MYSVWMWIPSTCSKAGLVGRTLLPCASATDCKPAAGTRPSSDEASPFLQDRRDINRPASQCLPAAPRGAHDPDVASGDHRPGGANRWKQEMALTSPSMRASRTAAPAMSAALLSSTGVVDVRTCVFTPSPCYSAESAPFLSRLLAWLSRRRATQVSLGCFAGAGHRRR